MKFDFNDVRALVHRAQHGTCFLCLEPIQDYHHRVHNTKTNRMLFPLFIDSVFNIVGLCRCCHVQFTKELSMTEDQARANEEYLKWVSVGNRSRKK